MVSRRGCACSDLPLSSSSLVAAGSSAAAADRRSSRIYFRSVPDAAAHYRFSPEVALVGSCRCTAGSAARLGGAAEAKSLVGLADRKQIVVGGGLCGREAEEEREKGERGRDRRERKNGEREGEKKNNRFNYFFLF